MISWGISANSHDAALAVFANQTLVFAGHSERFSGLKNDPNLHQDLVDYARERWGQPEKVYWYERPLLKSIRQLFAGQGLTFKENNTKEYLGRYGIDVPIFHTGHHRSHAAAGYGTSPYNDACVVVIDAIGEFHTASIWQASGNKLKKVYDLQYPHSVGLWYSAMTQRIGLKPNEEEYILMGMAAYGNAERLYDNLKNDFVILHPPWDTAGSIYFKQNFHKGCLNWKQDLTTEQDMFDIAAATQKLYETIFRSILQYAKSIVHSNNLVLMGGCALNCKANVIAYNIFENVYIMPNPGDAGSSIGAVLAHHLDWRHYQPQPFNPYLGYDMGHHCSNEVIVDYLVKHKICGIARGHAEFGPRALGNRSLIADPRGEDIKDKVNEIKQRQKFRPFAPAILAELADDYFDMPTARSPYMQVVARCRHLQLFPAIIHWDGTSRVQTVAADGSPFRKFLELWYKRTGCPMVLNTSLNIKGQPMVNDHADAAAWAEAYGLQVFT